VDGVSGLDGVLGSSHCPAPKCRTTQKKSIPIPAWLWSDWVKSGRSSACDRVGNRDDARAALTAPTCWRAACGRRHRAGRSTSSARVRSYAFQARAAAGPFPHFEDTQMLRIWVFAAALSTFVGSTFIQGAVLAAAKTTKSPVIKKKKGELACPPNTNDCSPSPWCCIKPNICVIGGCSRWTGEGCDRPAATMQHAIAEFGQVCDLTGAMVSHKGPGGANEQTSLDTCVRSWTPEAEWLGPSDHLPGRNEARHVTPREWPQTGAWRRRG